MDKTLEEQLEELINEYSCQIRDDNVYMSTEWAKEILMSFGNKYYNILERIEEDDDY